MSALRVTFLIPTWNRAALLARAVASVLTQPSADAATVEIIVVDDGSTDDTGVVLEGFTHDQRVRSFRQPTNRGVAAARNVGIRAATGSWIVLHVPLQVVQRVAGCVFVVFGMVTIVSIYT